MLFTLNPPDWQKWQITQSQALYLPQNELQQCLHCDRQLSKHLKMSRHTNVCQYRRKTSHIKQNAGSVTTTLAGGNHGLLALIITNAKYVLLTQQVWIKPPNLGQCPQIPAGTNQLAQENIISQWKNDFENWKLEKDVREALKNQILEAFNDKYLEDLKDPNIGYAAVTPLEMIEHLYQEYGVMTAQDILDNHQQLWEDFDTSTSIVKYFYNIKEICNMAEKAGQPTHWDLSCHGQNLYLRQSHQRLGCSPSSKLHMGLVPNPFQNLFQTLAQEAEKTGSADQKPSK